MNKLNLAVVGIGNIGTALVRRIEKMQENPNCPFNLVAICSQSPKKYIQLDGVHYTDDYEDIIESDNVDIIVETIGGSGIAFDLVSQALDKCKHVVTNNRVLVATQGKRLLRVAKDKNVHLRFEGSVMASTPCLATISKTLVFSDITRIYGILSSSCNYALMRMRETGEDLDTAIKAAKELGFAFGDYSAETVSKEVLYKLTILQALAFGRWADVNKIKSESIANITSVDIKLALKLGARIKLLGLATQHNLHVAPYLVDEMSMLGRVQGNMETVVIESKTSGSMMLSGEGGNREAIVDSLIGDISAVCHSKYPFQFLDEEHKKLDVVPNDLAKYYIRLSEESRSSFSANNNIDILDEIIDETTRTHALLVQTNISKGELKGLLQNCGDGCLLLGVFE